jgi:hypothetical protein
MTSRLKKVGIPALMVSVLLSLATNAWLVYRHVRGSARVHAAASAGGDTAASPLSRGRTVGLDTEKVPAAILKKAECIREAVAMAATLSRLQSTMKNVEAAFRTGLSNPSLEAEIRKLVPTSASVTCHDAICEIRATPGDAAGADWQTELFKDANLHSKVQDLRTFPQERRALFRVSGHGTTPEGAALERMLAELDRVGAVPACAAAHPRAAGTLVVKLKYSPGHGVSASVDGPEAVTPVATCLLEVLTKAAAEVPAHAGNTAIERTRPFHLEGSH